MTPSNNEEPKPNAPSLTIREKTEAGDFTLIFFQSLKEDVDLPKIVSHFFEQPSGDAKIATVVAANGRTHDFPLEADYDNENIVRLVNGIALRKPKKQEEKTPAVHTPTD